MLVDDVSNRPPFHVFSDDTKIRFQDTDAIELDDVVMRQFTDKINKANSVYYLGPRRDSKTATVSIVMIVCGNPWEKVFSKFCAGHGQGTSTFCFLFQKMGLEYWVSRFFLPLNQDWTLNCGHRRLSYLSPLLLRIGHEHTSDSKLNLKLQILGLPGRSSNLQLLKHKRGYSEVLRTVPY